jgi:bifunctional pyridoxal-dependent enzyme with beta-cystathionase and maltose regulon repressor activities
MGMKKDYFNSATIKSQQLIPGEKWHKYEKDVIPLYLAEPDFLIADEIENALIEAVRRGALLYHYEPKTFEAMAEKIKKKNRINAEPEDILLTQGVSPGMWLSIMHTCGPGDEVILTNPMYGPFHDAVEITHAKKVYWELDFDEGYRFDEEALKECITPRTKLIFVCNPHNPSGRVLTKQELKSIADIAIDHKIHVFSDELHEDIVYDKREHISIASLNPDIESRTMSSWGFSKTFGIAGLQGGYMCYTNKEEMPEVKRKSKGPLRETNSLMKTIAPIMLDDTLNWWRRDIILHLEKIRDLVKKRLSDIEKIDVPELQGTYLIFPRFNYDLNSEQMNDYLLKEARVSLNQGTRFGSNGEGHQRICIATSESIMNEALNRMEKALSKL